MRQRVARNTLLRLAESEANEYQTLRQQAETYVSLQIQYKLGQRQITDALTIQAQTLRHELHSETSMIKNEAFAEQSRAYSELQAAQQRFTLDESRMKGTYAEKAYEDLSCRTSAENTTLERNCGVYKAEVRTSAGTLRIF